MNVQCASRLIVCVSPCFVVVCCFFSLRVRVLYIYVSIFIKTGVVVAVVVVIFIKYVFKNN